MLTSFIIFWGVGEVLIDASCAESSVLVPHVTTAKTSKVKHVAVSKAKSSVFLSTLPQTMLNILQHWKVQTEILVIRV